MNSFVKKNKTWYSIVALHKIIFKIKVIMMWVRGENTYLISDKRQHKENLLSAERAPKEKNQA